MRRSSTSSVARRRAPDSKSKQCWTQMTMRSESKCPTSNWKRSSSVATKFIRRGITRSRLAVISDPTSIFCPYYCLTTPKGSRINKLDKSGDIEYRRVDDQFQLSYSGRESLAEGFGNVE